jgi:glycosyltransferase involved in cell wall biosynthesis
MSKELAIRGNSVTIYTTDTLNVHQRIQQSLVETDPLLKGVEVHYFRNMSNWLAGKQHLFLAPGLVKSANRNLNSFDIIHLQGARTTLHIPIHYYAKKYQVPYVIDAMGSAQNLVVNRPLKYLYDQLFGDRILREAAGVIVATRIELDEYRKLGVEGKQIKKIPLAFDVGAFSNLPSLNQFRNKFGIKEKHVILFLGRIHKIKGLDFMVESFYKLTKERSDIVLVIAGPDDGFKSSLITMIHELGISSKVVFTGFLGWEDKLSAYVDASMLVQPSRFERGPGSPFEAVLCNTPIIVTKDTGAGEIVADANAGSLVQFGNSVELALAMRHILDDPTEAMEKVKAAKQYIIENFSLNKVAEDYDNMFKSIAGKKNE